MVRKVGIFELELVQGPANPKWKVRNTITGVVHWTYGRRSEVEAQADLQTKAWLERLEKSSGTFLRKTPRYSEIRGSIMASQAAKK